MLAVAQGAHAQDDAPAQDGHPPALDRRASMLFSVERVFGILDQTYTGQNGIGTDLNGNGFFPQGLVGTRIGLHGVASSGITFGSTLGFWNESATDGGTGNITLLEIGPRIGWLGCLKKYTPLCLWVRGGPTFQYFALGGSNPGSDAWALDLSIEGFIVWSPVEHFGLLAGPTGDIGLAGHQESGATNGSWGYHATGAGFGLVFDL